METTLKKAAFWKYAAVASVCAQQEYSVYKALAKGCFFDMTKFLDKVIKRFWQAVPTGYSIDDSYLLAIEESVFSPRDEWEETALQIVGDLEQTFYAFFEKDRDAAFDGLNRRLSLVKKCAKLSDMTQAQEEAFLKKIRADQENMIAEIAAVPNRDKKKFLAEFQNRNWEETVDFGALTERRPVRGEKPAKKKIPEIRNTSVNFDKFAERTDNGWLLHATPEQFILKYFEESGTGGTYYQYYTEKKLAQLCGNMSVLYYSYVQRDYAENRRQDRVKGFWYLFSYSRLCAWELAEKGYPVPEKSLLRHDMSWHGDSLVYTAMVFAYAAGTEDLIPRLYHFAKGQSCGKTYTQAQDFMKILGGAKNETLVSRVEQWENSDMRDMLLWILKGEAKEFRKALLHSIRHDRKLYDMSGDYFLDPWAYSCVKIAGKHGIEVEPVRVAELLDWDFDETPVDREQWRLPLQDEIEEWFEGKK